MNERGKSFNVEKFAQQIVEESKHIPVDALEKAPGELETMPDEKRKILRMKGLLDTVWKHTYKQFYRMPLNFQHHFELDDCEQEAFSLLLDHISKYDATKSPSLNKYVMSYLPKRLTGKMWKSFLNINPPAKVSYEVSNFLDDHEFSQNISAKKLAFKVGCSEERAKEFLNLRRKRDFMASLSQEETYATREDESSVSPKIMAMLMCCIERLANDNFRMLFFYREFDRSPIPELYQEFRHIMESNGERISESTFERRYQKYVLEPVKKCIGAS